MSLEETLALIVSGGDLVLKTIVALNIDLSERVIEALNTLQIQPQTKIIFSYVLSSNQSDDVADQSHQPQELLYQKEQLQVYQAQFPGSEIEIISGDQEEINRLANIDRADLIVSGTCVKGVKRIIEGVSSQVVADAACSALVVKPEEWR